MKTGPRRQPMMNARVCTRSRNSRRITAHNLALTTHPLLDAFRADRLEEDLVQRRLHQLEARYGRSSGDETLEQTLGSCVACKLELEELVLVVHVRHERRVGEHGRDAGSHFAIQGQRDVLST